MSFRLVAMPHPFRTDRVERQYSERRTLAELLQDVQPVADLQHARILINDELVPREQYDVRTPVDGDLVVIRAVPAGSPEAGSKAAGWIGVLAVVIGIGLLFVPGAQGFGLALIAVGAGGAAAGFGVYTVLNLLSPMGDADQETDSPSIRGSRNQVAQWRSVPVVLGKHLVVPPFGAGPFTEIVGQDQYLRQLFILGYSPMTVGNLKIGDTAIGSYSDVEYQIEQDASTTDLVPSAVTETALSVLLESGVQEVRTGAAGVHEMGIDLTFSQGLVEFEDDGDKISLSVRVLVEVSPAGAGTWVTKLDHTFTAKQQRTLRYGYRWALAGGPAQFDVRVTRVTADRTGEKQYDKVYWTVIRSIAVTDPVAAGIRAKVVRLAVRIKATDQLNGVIDQLSAECTSKVPVYSGSGTGAAQWTTVAESPNPAALMLYLLRGEPNPKPVPDSQIDWPAFEAWYQWCASSGHECNAVVTTAAPLRDLLSKIAGTGRASISIRDGKYSVVHDVERTTPVQLFTPRNSHDFEAQKAFVDLPHALKMRFISEDAGWQEDEITVYDDGYGLTTTSYSIGSQSISVAAAARTFTRSSGSFVADGVQKLDLITFSGFANAGNNGTFLVTDVTATVVTCAAAVGLVDEAGTGNEAFTGGHEEATEFRTVEVWGITKQPQLWEDGRYQLAAIKLRPEIYSLHADVESIVCQRGDLVLVQHDTPLLGISAGRIKTLALSGSDCTGFGADEVFTMAAGKSYAVRIRKQDGTLLEKTVLNPGAGEYSSVTFVTSIAAPHGLNAGDLYAFGEVGSETREMVVVGVEMGQDLEAKLYLQDHSRAIYYADSGAIPAYTPGVTLPAGFQGSPPAPSIVNIRSDGTVLLPSGGDYVTQMLVTLAPGAAGDVLAQKYEIQWRLNGTDDSFKSLAIDATGTPQIGITDVVDGATYDVRARALGGPFQASSWTSTTHLVAGKTANPSNIGSLTANVTSLGIELSWPAVPDLDLAAYEVRVGASWAAGTTIFSGRARQFVWKHQNEGSYTFRVKAVDTTGHYSTTEATASVSTTWAWNRVRVAPSGYVGPAEYYCLGSNDHLVVLDAVNAVDARGGGTVELLAGTFYFGGTVGTPSRVAITGQGAATIIKGWASGASHFECVGTIGTHKRDVLIERMRLLAYSGATAGNGVLLQYVENPTVRELVLEGDGAGVFGNGINALSTWGLNVDNCWFGTAGGILRVDASWDFKLTRCHSELPGKDPAGGSGGGFAITMVGCQRGLCSGNTSAGMGSEKTGGGGISAQGSGTSDLQIEGNAVSGAGGSGVYVDLNCARVTIRGNTVVDCGQIYNIDGGGIAVHGDDCVIDGNTVKGYTGQFGGIRIGSNASNALVINNNGTTNYNQLTLSEAGVNGFSGLRWEGNGTLSNMTAAFESTQWYRDGFSTKLTKNIAAGTEALARVCTEDTANLHQFVNGESYVFSLMIRIPSSGGPAATEVEIFWREYYSGTWNEVVDTASVQDAWEELKITRTVNAAATGVALGLRIKSTAELNEYVFYDHALLQLQGPKNFHDAQLQDQGTNTKVA